MKGKLTKLLCCLFASTSLLLSSCDSLNGNDGNNGNDANIKVNEDGYIYINDEPTEYYFKSKDCKVTINAMHSEYGSVSGSGYYSYGQGVIITAIPNEKGLFVGWTDKDNKIISKDKELLIVADRGENIYTAIFSCKPELVKANINIKFDETSLPNATYKGERRVNLTTGVNLIFDGYDDKSLILYKIDKGIYDLSCSLINEKIFDKKIRGEAISYEEYVSLYEKDKHYYQEEIDCYFYVAGRSNPKCLVNISPIGSNGFVTNLDGTNVSSGEVLYGTVLKLKANVEEKEINGNKVASSRFDYWEINGSRVSSDNLLTYTVWESIDIIAHFTSKTKLSLNISSGEASLNKARYQDCYEIDLVKASINGKEFETNQISSEGKATIDLGYFDMGEVFLLELKLYARTNGEYITNYENVWKHINLSYYYGSSLIGNGNSLLFFVPPGTNNESNIEVKYIRTLNYNSNATNEDGNDANESLGESGFGLFD